MDRAIAEGMTPFSQSRPQLLDGDVACLIEKGLDHSSLRLHPPGAAISTQWPGAHVAQLAIQPAPAADTGCADPKSGRSLAVVRSRLHRGDDTAAKVNR